MAQVEAIRLHYNTIYVVEDGGERVLIDTGPDYRGAWDEVQEALAGRMPSLVVATHGHHDHAGMGARWQREGTPVALGRPDWRYTVGGDAEIDAEHRLLATVAAESGAPAAVLEEALTGLSRRMEANRAATSGYPPPGSRPMWPTGLRYERYVPAVAAADGEIAAGLRVMLCPGHTPGNCVVVHEGEGWLFSGDQLLPDITPTPGLQVDPGAGESRRFRSLPAFRSSHMKVRAHGFSRCFPGHGPAFDGVAETIEGNISGIDNRTDRIQEALASGGPATLYGLCERLYPRALQRRFWQIVPTVLGHLDLLEDEGRVMADGGTWSALA